MSLRPHSFGRAHRAGWRVAAGLAAAAGVWGSPAQATDYPVTPAQRSTAQQVAEAGIPLSELAPNAPDSHTVVSGDTLWGISKIFLKSPWRWPELWGMNLQEIRNPHRIYPGQVLVLDKTGGRARLRVGAAGGGDSSTVKLSPRVRSEALETGGIPSIPLHLIQPFLNEAVVFDTDELNLAPRIVATQEGRVLVSRGDIAYVRGDLAAVREYRVFRAPKALVDPSTREILGYEAAYLGTAEYIRPGETSVDGDGGSRVIPATVSITNVRLEMSVGDRLAPQAGRDYTNYTPHAPQGSLMGQLISVYGESINAGQNQIVALNRGKRDGMERGHVLALWHAGRDTFDETGDKRVPIRLPDERNGLLFVFSVFDRVSYALILNVGSPVQAGDRFSSP